MENNFRCICEHLEEDHEITLHFTGCKWNISFSHCRGFKLDNLKYLEQIYEENNKRN